MNWDRIQGNWLEFKGKLRTHYGALTDDDLEAAKGSQEQLVGLIQRKYGKTRDDAMRELDRLAA